MYWCFIIAVVSYTQGFIHTKINYKLNMLQEEAPFNNISGASVSFIYHIFRLNMYTINIYSGTCLNQTPSRPNKV